MAKVKQLSTTKRHQAARLLEKAIMTGQLRPGERLHEMKLASELNVSQACIREALQELEGLGFVIKYPNRGSFVMDLTKQDLRQIYQVRRQLEPLACALAAPLLEQEKLERLQDCLREMEVTAENHDYRAHVDADFRFHVLIWESQPNRYLERTLKAVCLPLFAGALVRRPSTDVNFSRIVRQHQLILSALQTGDASLAARVMQRILDRFLRQDLLDYFKLAKIVDKADGSKDRPLASLGDAVPIFE
ncbi:MAG: GntR family transcriptional regulator [Acidobacteria bacterium]|nr:GntR family transcriptional regulator [Acidobacteriota bacterium]MCI0627400.1 GntR family transcriptional regulator [Acidobacteriota bacterium]MCI0720325.1 GntR family transcriptional regulator [Acidobacteriota bacterium]